MIPQTCAECRLRDTVGRRPCLASRKLHHSPLSPAGRPQNRTASHPAAARSLMASHMPCATCWSRPAVPDVHGSFRPLTDPNDIPQLVRAGGWQMTASEVENVPIPHRLKSRDRFGDLPHRDRLRHGLGRSGGSGAAHDSARNLGAPAWLLPTPFPSPSVSQRGTLRTGFPSRDRESSRQARTSCEPGVYPSARKPSQVSLLGDIPMNRKGTPSDREPLPLWSGTGMRQPRSRTDNQWVRRCVYRNVNLIAGDVRWFRPMNANLRGGWFEPWVTVSHRAARRHARQDNDNVREVGMAESSSDGGVSPTKMPMGRANECI